MPRHQTSILLCATLLSVGLTALLGCADRAWDAALRADEPSAYYRYMRDHPDSPHVAEAKERLDFHKLKRDLTLPGFQAFVDKYPGSALAEEIRPQLEPHAFSAARAAGTVAAYGVFLERFPHGDMAGRAHGNAAYIEAKGFGGDPAQLATFAEDHPESDFAKEAKRSAEMARLIAGSHFNRVGLAIVMAPGTPEAGRLRNRFLERAMVTYKRAGVQLVPLPDIVTPTQESQFPKARLTIAHEEGEVMTSVEGGALSRPGNVAKTVVTLRAAADKPPVFEREFTLRVDSQEHVPGTSVLGSTAAPRYWEAFFVPVATSQTNVLRGPEVPLEAEAVDVDAVGDRTAVLYEDGRFQIVELADPENPAVLSEYTRPNDFKKWSRIRILGDKVAIYGEEGIELIGFGEDGPQVVLSLPRSKIGTVFALEPVGDALAVAGARGLLLVDPNTGGVKRLMRRVLKGLASVGNVLVFADGESIYVSDLKLIRQQRVHAQLKLGRSFDPAAVRSFGHRVVVVGGGGIVALDLSKPTQPQVTAKLLATDIGQVDDATAVAGRIFLLGDRGLMMMDRGASQVVQSVDVSGKHRLAAMGRHVVAVGEDRLQTVDAVPLAWRSLPASGRSGSGS